MDPEDIINALAGVRRYPIDDPVNGMQAPAQMPSYMSPLQWALTKNPQGVVPKAGATVQNSDVMSDITSMPGKAARSVADITGISDATKAIKGEMTPEEAQMFALGAIPALAAGPEGKIAEEVASRAPLWMHEMSPEAMSAALAPKSGRAAAITANNLRDMSPEDALKVAQSEAHIIPKTSGGYVGAPEWVKGPDDIQKLRDNFDADVAKGISGGDWYARAQRGIKEIAGLDPAKQHLLSGELALTSAQATPDTNLGFALQGHNAYEIGEPLDKVRTGQTAKTYNTARDTGTDISLGKKTGIYAGHLDPTIENPTTGTNDIWHARALGYTKNGKPWDSALTPQQHAFMDAETLLAVDRANKANLSGRSDWTPGEIQAAPWVAGKGEALAKERFGGDIDKGIAEASKTYPDYFDKYTAHGTYEATPGIGTGHLQGVATGSPELRAEFAADPRSSWMNDEGHDILYNALGAYQRRPVPATGVYQSPGGPLEMNPANVARPLVGLTGRPGARTIDPASRSMMNAAEAARAYLDVQNAGAYSKPITGNKPSSANSIFFQHDRPLSVDQIQELRQTGAAHGLPDVLDYGKGGALANFGGDTKATSSMVRALRKESPFLQYGKMGPAQMDTGYLGYEEPWRQPEGTGAVTKQLQEYMPNEHVVAKIDASPDVRRAALDRFHRDSEYAAQTGTVAREDVQRARQIVAESGFGGLFAALKKTGGAGLPAALLPVAAGALQEKRGE